MILVYLDQLGVLYSSHILESEQESPVTEEVGALGRLRLGL